MAVAEKLIVRLKQAKNPRIRIGIFVVFGILLFGGIVLGVYVTSELTKRADNIPPAEYAHRWLTQSPCAAPCWNGITPGKTSAAEVIARLKADPVISSESIDFIESLHIIYWNWTGINIYRGQIQVQENQPFLVESIDPGFSLEASQRFSLSEVMAVYGAPSYTNAYVCKDRNGDVDSYAIGILFSNYGIELLTPGSFDTRPNQIDGSLRFERVIFHTVPYQPKDSLNLMKWVGFAPFDIYVNHRDPVINSAC